MPGIWSKYTTWNSLKGIWSKDGANWRSIQNVWSKDGANWRLVFTALPPAIASDTLTRTRTGGDGTCDASQTNQYTFSWSPNASVNNTLHKLAMIMKDSAGLTCESKTETSPASINSWTLINNIRYGGTGYPYLAWSLQLKSDSSVLQSGDTYAAAKAGATCL